MIDFIRKKSFIVVFIAIVLIASVFICFYTNHVHAQLVGNNENIDGFLPAVVGDSYAGRMLDVDTSGEFKYFIFPLPGIDQAENVNIFTECINDKSIRYILYTTGVNDQARMLAPEVYKNILYNFAELAKSKNKYLFFHTYMNVPHEHIKYTIYKNTDYDNVLREIASDFKNVYYIDMSNMNDYRYVLSDKSHFNNLYHESLKAKFKNLIYDINKNIYWIAPPNESALDKNMIQVTGDSYAGTFYNYEKDKNYKMNELTKSYNTIIDNEGIILASLNTNAKYVLLSTSVNDFRENTDINKFEDYIRRYANIATENNKILFLHTYMNYVYYEDKTLDNNKKIKYTIEDYDYVLKKIAEEYDRVIYIDMSEYNNTIYMMPDLIHYGIEFNDALYNKIDYIINIL